MELVFGMVRAVFQFFVDIGNRVDFMGLDLFDISLIFFAASCLIRWVFPVVFAGEGATGNFLMSDADSVSVSSRPRFTNQPKVNSYGVTSMRSGAPRIGTVSEVRRTSLVPRR